jgi:hypothetical protein
LSQKQTEIFTFAFYYGCRYKSFRFALETITPVLFTKKKKKTLPVEVQRAKLPMHRKYFSPNKNNTKVTKLVYALQNSKQSVSNQEFGMNI